MQRTNCQSFGRSDCHRDMSNSMTIGLVITLDRAYTTFGWISSGSPDLSGLRFWDSIETVFFSVTRGSTGEPPQSQVFVCHSSLLIENTLLKCLNEAPIILALSLTNINRQFYIKGGGIAFLFWLRLIIYENNCFALLTIPNQLFFI